MKAGKSYSQQASSANASLLERARTGIGAYKTPAQVRAMSGYEVLREYEDFLAARGLAFASSVGAIGGA